MNKYILVAVFFSILVVSIKGYTNSKSNTRADTNIGFDSSIVKTGSRFPDNLVFKDTSGNEVKLSSLRGKYVLIDVWASWCYPCRVQQPYLESLQEKLKNRAITFVGISIDKHIWRWKGPILAKMPGNQWIVTNSNFEKRFGINAIPRLILLSKSGRILDLNLPLPSHPELEQQLIKLKGI